MSQVTSTEPTLNPSPAGGGNAIQKSTLSKLVSEHKGGIRIPMIQRDYAQGRPSWENSRNRFLSDIRESLMPEGKALHLDFVYGIKQDEDGTDAFCPLDGQQRLTTLFLLHWYLAARDDLADCFADFQRTFRNASDQSKFTYQVRPGGRSFFQALVEHSPDGGDWQAGKPSEWFGQQSWFRSIWKRDPSVAGALVMLDAIHEVFHDAKEATYQKIANGSQITFQRLDLQAVGLHDDLYLRMNARGRPLTTFETFKARFDKLLESEFPDTEQLKQCTVKSSKDFADRIDTAWLDFIWNHYGPTNVDSDDTSSIDRAFINLFRAVALASLEPTKANEEEKDTKEKTAEEEANKKDSKYVQSLSGGEPDYDDFENGGWLTRKFTTHLIHVLEACESHKKKDPITDSDFILFQEPWFGKGRQLENIRLLDLVIRHEGKKPDYSDLLQFAAYVRFLTAHGPVLNQKHHDEFTEWNRVVRNLVVNTAVRAEVFLDMLSGLDQLLKGSKEQGILNFLADTDGEISGFSKDQVKDKDQVKEERLKAMLIRADKSGWRKLIQDAENHLYFRGQIDFLLDFSGAKGQIEDHAKVQEGFRKYLERAKLMFGDNGLLEDLKNSEFLWQRALLAKGDYLLHYSGGRRSLLDPWRDGSVTWKRFLRENHGDKRGYLKDLWDDVDMDSIESSLKEVLRIANEGPPEKNQAWRKVLCGRVDVWQYCGDRLIHFQDRDGELEPRVCLMEITNRINKRYEELYTYCLRIELGLERNRLDEDRQEYSPLRYAGWHELPGSYHPHLKFELEHKDRTLVFQLYCHCHMDEGFSLRIPLKELGDDKDAVTAYLRKLGFESELKSGDPVQNPNPWWLGEHLVFRQDPADPLDGASFLKTVADKLSQLA